MRPPSLSLNALGWSRQVKQARLHLEVTCSLGHDVRHLLRCCADQI
jgi:hypothetical protein